MLTNTELLKLFNENNIKNLKTEVDCYSRKENLKNFLTIFELAIRKNQEEMITYMLSKKNMRVGQFNNSNVFKMAIAYGSLDFCKKMVEKNWIKLSNNTNILESAIYYKSYIYDMKNMGKKIDKIRWILSFPTVKKELENFSLYRDILLRDHNKLFLPIILPLIEKEPYFDKLYFHLIALGSRYHKIDLIDYLIKKYNFPINEKFLKVLVYNSLISEDVTALEYCLKIDPQSKNIVEDIIINNRLPNIQWTEEKYNFLKDYKINLFKNCNMYLSVWQSCKDNKGNHAKYYPLLDLLDLIKSDLIEHSDLVHKLYNCDIFEEHKLEFININKYYTLQKTLPNKKHIEKIKKI